MQAQMQFYRHVLLYTTNYSDKTEIFWTGGACPKERSGSQTQMQKWKVQVLAEVCAVHVLRVNTATAPLTTNLASFAVYYGNVFPIFRQPLADVDTKLADELNAWRVVVIKRKPLDTATKPRRIIRSLWTSDSDNYEHIILNCKFWHLTTNYSSFHKDNHFTVVVTKMYTSYKNDIYCNFSYGNNCFFFTKQMYLILIKTRNLS